MKEFRPISLCNLLYKIVAKTLANQIKTTMPTVIEENHSAFIFEHHIGDNIMLGFECNLVPKVMMATHEPRQGSKRTPRATSEAQPTNVGLADFQWGPEAPTRERAEPKSQGVSSADYKDEVQAS